jgi:hypothetical protein
MRCHDAKGYSALNGVVTMTKNSQKLLVLPMKKLLALQPFGWCIGITSLSPEEASPKRLLDLVRSHWHIENKIHWVRDVRLDRFLFLFILVSLTMFGDEQK